MVFMQQAKLYQMFSVFSVFTQTHKKIIYCKFVSKRAAWVFFEDNKMWPSHNLLNC